MDKNMKLDTLIKDLLGNGKRMAISEIQEAAKRKLTIEDYDYKQIYNYIYNMKKRGEIQKTTDGKYYLENILKEETEEQKQCFNKVSFEEYEDFEIIDPLTTRTPKEVLSVMSSGTIAMNPVLLKHFVDFSAEIRLKKDCTEIIMLKNGEVLTNLGKQGRVKNYNLVERLKKANMKFPIYFVGEWDEEKGMWHGKYLPYNPNKGKKEKQR